jgi:hypothetical protein
MAFWGRSRSLGAGARPTSGRLVAGYPLAVLCIAGCGSVAADDHGTGETALVAASHSDGSGEQEHHEQEWQRALGAVGEVISTSGVASDAGGNAFVTGYIFEELGESPHASSDAFVAKYSAAGELLWTRQLGTAESDAAAGSSSDSAGNVFIAGDTSGAMDGMARGFGDGFVAKYSPDGELEWTRQVGTSQPDAATGVSADADGNVFVAGFTRGSLEGGRDGRDVDAFVAKYSAAGELLWSRQLGSSVGYDERASGVSVDAEGNVIVAGHSFGGLEGDNRGSADAFVAKLSADGELRWLRQHGATGHDAAEAVSADGEGNVYVSGQMGGVLPGGPSVVLPGNPYVAKYSPAGELLWEIELEDASAGSASRITTDGEGRTFIAGYTSGSWGGPNEGLYDSFVAELSGEGEVLWVLQLGFEELDQATGVSASSRGAVFVSRNAWNLGEYGSDAAFLSRVVGSGGDERPEARQPSPIPSD